MAINLNFTGLRSILVDVDAMAQQHPALDAALAVAACCRAKVKIVDVVWDVPDSARDFVTPRLEREILENHREHLVRLACWRQRSVLVETALLRGAPGIALVQEVLRSGHDLLVRARGRDLPTEAPAFDPVDLHLLRTCPCPVWLVGPHDCSHAPHIVAAVDASSKSAAEQALNRQIVELSQSLCEARGGSLTVVHAWQPFGEYLLQPRMPPLVFADFMQRAERAAYLGTAALVEPFGERLRDVHVEVVRGEPPEIISAVAAARQADVIVMGSMSRSGLAGIFLGNTAERVLRRWHGSVLVVKPLGFISPIVLEPDTETHVQPM
jgi:universal stress protein E